MPNYFFCGKRQMGFANGHCNALVSVEKTLKAPDFDPSMLLFYVIF